MLTIVPLFSREELFERERSTDPDQGWEPVHWCVSN
jgi:hypothetical protein